MSEQKTGARRASHHRHDARARRYVRRDAIRRNALSAVRPSPARAASPDAKVWLPLEALAALPALDELLESNVAPNARTHTVLRSAHNVSTAPAGRALPKVHPSPARARPHDPDSWFPLAALEELLAPDRLVDSGQTRAVAPEHEPMLRAPAVDSPDVVDVVDLEQLWELQPVAHPEPVSDLRPDPDPELAPRPLIVPEPRSAPEAMPSPAPLRAVPQPTRRDRIAIRRARARRRLLVVTLATTLAGVGALAAALLGATATETGATTHRGTASTTSTRGGSLRWLFTAAAAAPAAPAPAAPSTPPPAAAPVPATPVVRAPAPPPPKKPVPAPRPTVVMPHTGNTRSGTATWYSHAAGTCAHLGLRMGTSVRITNTANGATASCTVADRGPEAWTGNLIDLSPDVFRQLAPLGAGRINVRLDY
jgi:hypothetical protein